MTLSGPDASHHQGFVDWRAVKAAGHTFAFCKLTDGTSYNWVQWGRANLQAVRATGLVPGAYHWLNTSDGAAQARYFASELNKAGGIEGTLCAVDVEKNPDGSFPNYSTVQAFVTEWRKRSGGHPLIVYTGRWFWASAQYLGNPPGAAFGPLWHASYTKTPGAMYGGWTVPTFWQYTSSGACPGINGSADLSRFYGDRAELLALTGQPTTQEDDMTPDECRHVVREELNDYFASCLSWLSRGQGNTIVNPSIAGSAWAWADDAGTVTLNEVLAAVKAQKATVDVPALATALKAALGEGPDVVTIETALRTVLAEVELDGHLKFAAT